MLLTITTSHCPATDLGYLLHKNPAHAQSFELSFGQAHVFYPEVRPDCCTAALLLDVDPIGLVRGRKGAPGEGHALEQYVNDRPYAASSFLSVAISQTLSAAMGGRSKERPELARTPIPLTATISALPCRGGERFLRSLFEPLGYAVRAEPSLLDETFTGWGQSRYYSISLTRNCTVAELLTHLYVLIPVLDDDKHYWVGEDEVEKLLRHGQGWLASHPEREAIVSRYLKRRRALTRSALARLLGDESDPEETEPRPSHDESPTLNQQRLSTVLSVLKTSGARRVLDLGCGEGHLLRLLLADKQFETILGMDVSHRALEIATERLNLERLPDKQKARIQLLQGSLMYKDNRLAGYDAAAVIEVIEHLDAARLAAFERVLFEQARPTTVVLTTPNSEYNALFPDLPAGKVRHRDHRFEWKRGQFEDWSGRIAARFGYEVRFQPVGPVDPELGAPTQMGVFTLAGQPKEVRP